MYNINKLFSEENFGAEKLDKMIDTAINLYIEKGSYYPDCFWISYDILEAVAVDDEAKKFEGMETGFIVEITGYRPNSGVMEDIAQSFITYINKNYNRNFSLIDWEDKEIINFDEKLFTKEQLLDIYLTCYEKIEYNLSKSPYYVIVDMEKYECIGTTKIPIPTNNNFEYILIDPTSRNFGYPDFTEDCKEAIEKHFNIKFDFEIIYGFDITYYVEI